MIIKAEVDSEHLAMVTALVNSPENMSGPAGCKGFHENLTLPKRFVSIMEVKRGRRHEHLVTLDVATEYNIERYGVFEARQLPASYLRRLADALGVFPEEEAATETEPMKPTEAKGDAMPRLSAESHKEMQDLLLWLVTYVWHSASSAIPGRNEKVVTAICEHLKGRIDGDTLMNNLDTYAHCPSESSAHLVRVIGRLQAIGAIEKPAEPKPGVIPLTPELLRAFHAIGTLPLEYHPHTFGAWLVGIVVRYYENAPDLRFQLDQAGALNSELKDDIYFKLIVAHLRKHCLGENETPAEPMPGKTP